MKRSTWWGLGILLGAALGAQEPAWPAAHVLRGVVYDSVAKGTLAGAVVQVTSADAAGRVFTANADGSGRYRITGLPSGRFVVGIDHEATRALRLDAPLRSLELAADSLVTVDLAIPSGASLHTLFCTDTTEVPGDGMLAGFVRDARHNEPIAGAFVVLEWTEVALQPGNMRTVPKHAMARTDADGTYRACGVPGDVPVGIRVSAQGSRAFKGKITVPANGVLRRDFRLADSSVAHGPATLSGRVSQTFALGDKAQPLAAINVIGKPGRPRQALDELRERRRIGMGTAFLPGSSALKSATRVTDVFRVARGFSYSGSTDVVQARGGCQRIAVYVDGSRWHGMSLRDVSDMIPPRDVLAIETFPDLLFVPPQWRTGDVCAVVSILTRQ